MGPGDLAQVLRHLPSLPTNRDLLVGLSPLDDAAVYRLADDLALVQTVDFFTPVVDDPRTWGRIAAANALSDVYAMGARPILALNVVSFPVNKLPLEVLGDVLAGGAEKLAEAGVALGGGHSVDDPEPKYGLAVTGLVDPARMVTKGGARPGDRLILTKPIGCGVITTAAKRGAASAADLAAAARCMEQLNAAACQAMLAAGAGVGTGIGAATDITGFGLAGHASEMARASGVCFEIAVSRVPLLPGAREYARQGFFPGGSRANRQYLTRAAAGATSGAIGAAVGSAGELDAEQLVVFDDAVGEDERGLMCDAMTSGGLLVALPPEGVGVMMRALGEKGLPAWEIGRVTASPAGVVKFVP